MNDPLPYTLRLLKSRLRTEWEIDQAMLRHEVPAENRQNTIARLKEAKLLDDYRFALAWVHTRDRLSPRGESVLRMELMQKGVPKHLIDQALRERREAAEELEDEQPTELELARDLLERHTRQFASLAPEVRKRRQTAYLQRRGFSYDVIKRILEA